MRHRIERRLAILNGFGMTLGDGVIGLTALLAARAEGALQGRLPVLVRKPLFGRRLVNALYVAARPFAETAWFPYRAALRRPFEERIDIREFAFDPAFRGVSMIDYFLTRLGCEPAAIPPESRRNLWLARALRVRRPLSLPPAYVLLCPRAAIALRCMPAAFHDALIEILLAMQELPVVTQASPRIVHERIVLLPAVASLAELGGLVASARLVVSTDTAMVHLADAWSIPTIAFFVTHRPEWRVRDYPFCRAVHLPAALPAALEFPRGQDDVDLANEAWWAQGHNLVWLEPLIRTALAAGAGGGT